MSKMQRDKGGRGQREAKAVLESHGYHVSLLACGQKSEDLLAEYDTLTWSVEVKHHAKPDLAAFEAQARRQAKELGLPWMLMVRLPKRPHTFLVLTDGDEHIMRLREDV
jgi:Holliday junction resolvase